MPGSDGVHQLFPHFFWLWPCYLQADGLQCNHISRSRETHWWYQGCKATPGCHVSHRNRWPTKRLPICTPRLFPRPMEWFVSIIYHKIVHVFLVTTLAQVFISEELETRLLQLLLVLMMSFPEMTCSTTVIGPITTLVNVIYFITAGPAHSPSNWVIVLLRPLQFIKNRSIIIGSFYTSVPTWYLSQKLLSYKTSRIATHIRKYVYLQTVGIYTINSLSQWTCRL